MPPVPDPGPAGNDNAYHCTKPESVSRDRSVRYVKHMKGADAYTDEYREYLAEIGIGKTPDAPEETFSDMLFRLIQGQGTDGAECHRKADTNKRVFSKIICDRNCQPKKDTVISFAVAPALPTDDTPDILHRAGYTLSPATERDRTVETFIPGGVHGLHDLNMALYPRGCGEPGERRQAATQMAEPPIRAPAAV